MKKQLTYETKSGRTITRALPARNEVCGRCRGTGKHLREGMEGVAYTREEMLDDPDFEEDYFGGKYDVRCLDCGGRNVIPVIDEDELTPSQRRLFDQVLRAEENKRRLEDNMRLERFYENGGRWGQ